ncbi:MAG: MATE family efflux transporter [Pseudomonadota bacterium]
MRHELRVISRLSGPVVLTQLGMMMIGVVDTLMVSRLGVTELAGSALGNMWQWMWMSGALDIVMGIDPLISQAHGRGDGPGTALALQRGLVLAVLVSLPVCVLLALTRPGLVLLGQEVEIAERAARYNLLKLPTVPGSLIYAALRQYLQGRTLMAPATWVMWLGNAVNAVLNWGLIFGNLGMPALGLEGAAIASSITSVLLVIGLVAWIRLFRLSAGAWRPWDRESSSARGLLQVVRLGLPVGAQIALEGWAFAISTLMAGWLGRQWVGSHQIVHNLVALSFMVPLGISQGAATRVGNLIGAGDEVRMRAATKAALLLGGGVMLISATLFTTLRFALPRLYTDDPKLVSLAATILPIAAAFQLSDGTQVVAGGLLRGMGRPDAAAYVNLFGYYVVALPLAYFFGFVRGYGLPGVWACLAAGLTVVALALLVWVRRTALRPLADLRVAADSGLQGAGAASGQ